MKIIDFPGTRVWGFENPVKKQKTRSWDGEIGHISVELGPIDRKMNIEINPDACTSENTRAGSLHDRTGDKPWNEKLV